MQDDHNAPVHNEARVERSNPLDEPEMAFLLDLRAHTVDGRVMLGDEKTPYNISKVYTEDDFVRNWLIQFALGNSFGINYFNHHLWGKETNMGALAAMVVDTENKPVLFIPPIVSNNMSSRDYELLRFASYKINANERDAMMKNNPHASNTVAQKLKENLTAKALTVTDMITPNFYAKHGIVPDVEKQAFYVRDVINQGSASADDMMKVRDVLYRIHREEPVTKEEFTFLYEVSRGEYEIPKEYKPSSEADYQTPVPSAPFDPFQC